MTARDVGLAAERTALAWRRTAISAMVVAALCVDHALSSGWRDAAIAPAAAALTMVAVAVTGYLRSRWLRHGRRGRADGVIAATALAILFAGGVGVALGFTDPPR
ncbi:protein of unknown function (DUF202) [Nocardia amikacinitolerans]|uniref:DUF202 domain-containing protein n=1 Tax=Nocardia amikacinitolerans TaxID=756689 RepID=UPI00082BCE00|nr:DUF202 domain-containing protein [Nocardia amikacinitolerans]MCP2316942.1 protein of unknown function (DUF202) [Nocardia amikacinitolerans]